MTLQLNCIKCLFDRHFGRAAAQPDKEKAVEYMKEFCRLMGELEPEAPTPVVAPRINDVYERLFGKTDKYEKIKKRSNDYVESKAAAIAHIIDTSPDPLLTALKYARVGNYIDFAALGDDVSEDTLDKLLEGAVNDEIDPVEYARLLSDLETAKQLVYLPDNAGEIVLDRLFIERLKKRFPQLEITLAVRAYPIVNDVTIEDASYTGIDKLVKVIDNGSRIAGTYLPDIGGELKSLLDGADVIIAKGQGNFETMHGCGLNVYYVFLCKCELFRTMFNAPQLAGMFVNEKRAPKK